MIAMLEQLEGRTLLSAAVDRSIDVPWIGTVTLASTGTLLISGLANPQELTVARRSGDSTANRIIANPRAKLTDVYVFRESSPWVQHMVFDRSAKTAAVEDPIRRATGEGPAFVIQAPGGSNVVVPINLVRRIQIQALGGDDRVVLKGVVRPTTVMGGAGDDTLCGDGGTDQLTLDGAAGDDTLIAQARGSKLIGGEGKDRVVGDRDDAMSGVEQVET
jgi:Ca2+-binding RTX toxin-like protein